MKSRAAMILIVLFAALIIQCAFDGPSVQASPASSSHSQGDSVVCGSLNAAGVELPIFGQPAVQAATGKAVGPLAEEPPLWSLAQSIDHPPERPL